MTTFVPDLMQDLRYAFRTARRSPGFLAVVTLSIGIGVAANATIFSIANAVLFGALPVHDADRLVNLANDQRGSSFSYPTYQDLRRCEAFEDLTAHFPLTPVSFSSGGSPERIWGAMVSGNYFAVIGVPMALGRGILPEEDDRHEAVVVLSDALWKRRFAADPAIVGRTVTIDNRAWRVAGVAAPGFHGSVRMLIAEFWVPLSAHEILLPEISHEEPVMKRDNQWLFLDARLKPGVSRTQALAAVNVINARLDDEYNKAQRKSKILLETSGKLPGDMGAGAQGFFAALTIVVGLVLAVACANVANLLLARAAGRQREIAMRLAVGAGRGRLIRQLLAESVLLSVLGSAAGFLLSFWTTALIAGVDLPIPIPLSRHLSPDLRVLAFTTALAVGTGILFGLAPAIRATTPDLAAVMKKGDLAIAGFRRFGLRNALVVMQVAFSLVLLISAGLFLRSLGRAASLDLGIGADAVLSVAFDPNQHSTSPERIAQLLDQVRGRVAALPGVASASFTDFIPLSVVDSQTSVRAGESEKVPIAVFQVGSGYFDTMGIRLLAGRDFGHEGKAPVAILNRAAAEKLFPGASPLGRTVHTEKTSYEVIGVAANSKLRTLGEGDRAGIYLPLEQNMTNIMSLTGVALVAKAARPAETLEAVKREIRSIDPNLALYNAITMREQAEKALLLPRLAATLFGIFGVAGTALAVIGLYGSMSFSVGRRTKEIGIRMGLGAERKQILGMITRQGMTLIAVGLATGTTLALAASRILESFLYGIGSRDLATFTAVPLILAAVGFVAAFVPARRAAKLNPIAALRYE
ncbi:MAG: ABC transporter permease [Acidobacteriia bacterium]|nr:ABC transporter permease [Terriglobia bacterium]